MFIFLDVRAILLCVFLRECSHSKNVLAEVTWMKCCNVNF